MEGEDFLVDLMYPLSWDKDRAAQSGRWSLEGEISRLQAAWVYRGVKQCLLDDDDCVK